VDPGLIRHTTASHASSKQQKSRKALVGKKYSRKTVDVARESRKNVLGSGNRDAVIGARRYVTVPQKLYWAAKWHKAHGHDVIILTHAKL
jgi:hypothetical protein